VLTITIIITISTIITITIICHDVRLPRTPLPVTLLVPPVALHSQLNLQRI